MRALSSSLIFTTAISVFVLVSAFPTDNEVVEQLRLDEYNETRDSNLIDDTTTRRRIKRSDLLKLDDITQNIINILKQICPPLADLTEKVYAEIVKKITEEEFRKAFSTMSTNGGQKNNDENLSKRKMEADIPNSHTLQSLDNVDLS